MKVVDYQKVDLNDEEWAYYSELLKQFGPDEFKGLLVTDSKGLITMIKPTKPVSWVVLHWAQQVQINQHLRENDARIDAIEKQVSSLVGKLSTITWRA
jgi:hypothetical protein